MATNKTNATLAETYTKLYNADKDNRWNGSSAHNIDPVYTVATTNGVPFDVANNPDIADVYSKYGEVSIEFIDGTSMELDYQDPVEATDFKRADYITTLNNANESKGFITVAGSNRLEEVMAQRDKFAAELAEVHNEQRWLVSGDAAAFGGMSLEAFKEGFEGCGVDESQVQLFKETCEANGLQEAA